MLIAVVFLLFLPGLHSAPLEDDFKYYGTDNIEKSFKADISARPQDPAAHWSYAQFFLDRREWKNAVFHLKNRLYALLDSDIVLEVYRLQSLERKADHFKQIVRIMNVIRGHKRIEKKDKDRLLVEAAQKLAELPPLELLEIQIENLKTTIPQHIESAESSIRGIGDREKRSFFTAYMDIAAAYYNMGYQCPSCMDSHIIRETSLEGISYLEKVCRFLPQEPEPYLYLSKFYRLKIILKPLQEKELARKADNYLETYETLLEKMEVGKLGN